jgi:hypothetical protein
LPNTVQLCISTDYAKVFVKPTVKLRGLVQFCLFLSNNYGLRAWPAGLLGMALSIGALVGNVAVDTVQAAMTETTTHDVRNWCRLHIGPTVQSVRQRIRQAIHTEQKQKTLRLESG